MEYDNFAENFAEDLFSMEYDNFAENFAEALFSYLWFSETLISNTKVVETINKVTQAVGDITKFVLEAAKAVVLLSVFYDPFFYDNAENHFQRNTITRERIFIYLAKYCFQNHAETDDVFAVVLRNCSIIYRLTVLCQRMGHPEYLLYAAMCWSEIFQADLKEEFHAKGGWDEFRTYMAEKRYAVEVGELPDVLTFEEEIDYIFPKFEIINPEVQASLFTSEAMANLQIICAETTDESLTNDEGVEFPVGTVDRNMSDFNEKSQYCTQRLDNPQINCEAAKVSFCTVGSNGLYLSNKSKDSTDEVVKQETNDEAAGFSFGTVDQIAPNIPEFNGKSKVVVFQYDNSNAKIVKLSKKSKSKSHSKSGQSKMDLVMDANVLVKNETCTSMQYTETTSTITQPNATSSSTESSSESEDIAHKLTDLVLRAAIEKDKEEGIQANMGKEIQDSDIKNTAPETFNNAGNCSSSVSEINVVKDDQASLKDFLSRQSTESSFVADTELLSDKIYINGVCFEKFVRLTVKKVETICNEDNSEGVSGTSETGPKEMDTSKEDQTLFKDLLSHQMTGNPNGDNMKLLSEKLHANGECFEKYVKLTVKNSATDSNGTVKDAAINSNGIVKDSTADFPGTEKDVATDSNGRDESETESADESA